MRHRRHLPAERVVDLGLPRSVGEMVVAPDDVGHAHIVIVDHHRQHVCRRAVGTQEHEIVEVLVLPYHAALNLIVNRGLAGDRRPQADHRLDPGGGLGGVAVAPTPVIELGATFAPRPLAHLVELLLGGVAAIGLPGGKQLLGHLAVPRGAGELIDGVAVPFDPEPGQPIEDRGDRVFGGAFAVGILDPQQHLASAPSRIEPIEQRGARPSDVEEAGGRRCEAGNDGGGHMGTQISLGST